MNMFAGAALTGAAISSQRVAAAGPASLDPSEASPELRAAIVDLREAQEALEAARAQFAGDDLKLVQWRESHPEPTSKRGKKRYWRKFHEAQDEIERPSWEAQLDAERHFRKTQSALAAVEAKNMDEIELKAAAALVYDRERCTSYGSVAIVSYGVTMDLMRMRRGQDKQFAEGRH